MIGSIAPWSVISASVGTVLLHVNDMSNNETSRILPLLTKLIILN